METAIAPIAAAPEQGILLTYDEVALYESISRREVFNRVREGRYRIVPGLSLSGSGGTPRLAGNGRPVNRIPLSCLSPGAQAAFRQMTDEARAVGEARYGAAGVAHRLRCTGAAPQRSRCAAPVAPSPVAGIAAAESAEAGGRPLRAAEPALPARPEPLRARPSPSPRRAGRTSSPCAWRVATAKSRSMTTACGAWAPAARPSRPPATATA